MFTLQNSDAHGIPRGLRMSIQLVSLGGWGRYKWFNITHAILDIISTIQQNMDHKRFSCAVFIDLKKAFDTVDYQILLKKLYCYGIRGIIYEWFKSYLSNRTQTTEINGLISTKDLNPLEVPQGSALGPLLFLLYINDITIAYTKLIFFLFADDTNWLYADKNLKTLESTISKKERFSTQHQTI